VPARRIAHVDMPDPERTSVTLFLCGDVMLGRGVDQILPCPSDRRIHESCLESALDYVALAEARDAPIARPVDFAYVWGDALAEFERRAPDVKVVNLEGIGGYEQFRSELGLMYFPRFDLLTGALVRFDLVPTRIRRFRVNRASSDEARVLCDGLNREGARFGTAVRLVEGGALTVERGRPPSVFSIWHPRCTS
jgi:poly-gamma-glutamate capsule biosynthesis protein CapA/YwtB (metallophosphatase superfamily)